MAEKPNLLTKNKFKNRLKMLATTSALVATIASSSTAFGGAVANARETANANAPVSEVGAGGLNLWSTITAGGVVVDPDASGPADNMTIRAGINGNIIFDVNKAIKALDLNGKNVTMKVANGINASLGSIVNIAGGGNPVDIDFTGTGGTFTFNGAAAGGGDDLFVAPANKGALIGQVDFDQAGLGAATRNTFVITAAGDVDFTNFTVGNANSAIIEARGPGVYTFNDKSVAAALTHSIGAGSAIKFYSTQTAGGVLNLQTRAYAAGATVNDRIVFEDAASKLILASKQGANNALSFKVQNGSLGGTNNLGAVADDFGVIHFDTSDANGNAATLTTNAAGATAVIGVDRTHRAREFIVTAAGNNANVATIKNQIFAKTLSIKGDNANAANSAPITFEQTVDVGDDGATKFYDNATKLVTISKNSNLGKVDFNNIKGVFEVAAAQDLKGSFIGDAANAANIAGTIRFAGAGTLAQSAGADYTTQNLTAVETNGGDVTLTGKFINTPLQITNVGGSFILANDFEQDGGINIAVGALAGNGLKLLGNATISGDIGANGAIGNITLADDATKTLTLKTTNLIMNGANNLIFGAKGGTVAITDPSPAKGAAVANLNYTMNIALGADNKGTIDATSLQVGQTLHITGNIAANKSLEALSVANGANLHFTPGNAGNFFGAQTLTLDEKSELTFDTGTYKFVNVPEAAAKVTINGDVTFGDETTVLGTKDKTIDAFEFSAAGSKLALQKNVSIYTTADTILPGNAADAFIFNGGGTNVVSAKLGTTAKLFNTLTVSGAKTIVELQKGGIFSGATLTDADTTLTFGDSYTTTHFGAANAAGMATIKTNNASGMILAVAQQAANAAAPRTLVVSGSNVTINETAIAANAANAGDTHGLVINRIDFTNKDVASTVTLAQDMNDRALALANVSQLENMEIFSTAGNSNAHTVVIKGSAAAGSVHKVTGNRHIGSDINNPVNISLGNPNYTLVVDGNNFFAGVLTTKANTGTAQFKNANAAYSRVVGIGEAAIKFGNFEFFTTTENFSDTYSKAGTVYNGATGTFAKNFNVTTLHVGANAGGGGAALGNSNVVYRDNITLDNSTLISHGVDNIVIFEGKSGMNNSSVGTASNPFDMITHSDDASKTAEFSGAYYADTVDFGNVAIKVKPTTLNNATNTVGGVHYINNMLDVADASITFMDINRGAAASEWGEKTALTVQITDAGVNNVVNKTTINVLANKVGITLAGDTATVEQKSYILMDNSSGKLENVKADTFYITNPDNSGQRFAGYAVALDNKNIVLTRTDTSHAGLKQDLSSVGGNSIDLENALKLPGANRAEFGRIDQTKSGNAVIRLTRADESATQVMQETATEVGHLVSNRLIDAALVQGGNLPDQGAPSAGDDDTSTANRYGSWAMPFYSQSVKKDQGVTAGYKSKAVGGVFGFDTKANDNMTIGAAVSLIKTDVKHKGWKAGDKTTINSYTFSVYGVQQLAMDFFAQGVVTFGSNKVKGKALRYGLVNQTAYSNYDSMSFGGELMFGYNAKPIDNVLFTPLAGIRYNKVNDEGYKETGTTIQNKTITKKNSHKVEGIIGARVVSSIETNGLVLNPEVHGFISHKLGGKDPKITSKLDTMTDTFTAQANKTPKTYFNLGASMSTKVNYMEYGVAYDATIAKKYLGHMGSIKVRVNF